MIESKTLRIPALAPRVVQVKELTMGDMRAMLRARESMGEDDIDPLDLLPIKDGLLLSDVPRICDIKHEDLDKLTENDIENIVEAAKRLNPRFFDQILGMLTRLARMSLNGDEAYSSETSSPLSGPDTLKPGTIQ